MQLCLWYGSGVYLYRNGWLEKLDCLVNFLIIVLSLGRLFNFIRGGDGYYGLLFRFCRGKVS